MRNAWISTLLSGISALPDFGEIVFEIGRFDATAQFLAAQWEGWKQNSPGERWACETSAPGLRVSLRPLLRKSGEAEAHLDDLRLLRFDEIGGGAFRTYLPLAVSLAAGSPFHGFETEDLAALDEFDWIEVPPTLAKEKRFVVRVAGDSVEPTLKLGDLVAFEYHRTPRSQGQIVIANLPEFGRGSTGTEAIKRIREERDFRVFESDNPSYEAIRVEKGWILRLILGTMVELLSRG